VGAPLEGLGADWVELVELRPRDECGVISLGEGELLARLEALLAQTDGSDGFTLR
jgi:hypothetical protein